MRRLRCWLADCLLEAMGPIFLENPDGSITEAVPLKKGDGSAKDSEKAKVAGTRSGYGATATGEDSDGSLGSNTVLGDVPANFARECEFMYSRHATVFSVMLFIQLVLEALYMYVFMVHMQASIDEVRILYKTMTRRSLLESLFCVACALEVSYAIGFYTLAGMSLWTRWPKHYQLLSSWAMVGMVILILYSYLDKFNLPLFFLRFLAYIYARYLQSLASSLLLLPRSPAAAARAAGLLPEDPFFGAA